MALRTKLNTVNYLKPYLLLKDYSNSESLAGSFRFIIKCRAGFLTILEARHNDNKYYLEHPETLLSAYGKGSLHTIEFLPTGGDYWLTIFARKGRKIALIDETILNDLTVGTINQYWMNTDLYDQLQYSAVGARTWADKAYVVNPVIAGIEFTSPNF